MKIKTKLPITQIVLGETKTSKIIYNGIKN